MTTLYGPSTRPEGFPVLPDAVRTVPFQQVTGPDTGRQHAALTALAVTSADTYPMPVVAPEPQSARAARRMSRNDKLLLAGIYVALIAANVAIFPPLRHGFMAGYDRAWPYSALAAPVAGVAVLGWRARAKVRAFAVALAGAAPWPLLAVLTVQAVLSLRLVWSNTAFTDEALYLWAGHLEWAHWLHGTAIPAFPAYFSGAPVIYPPLGALADSVGGLALARLLSLGFMLGATALLWSTTERLYGKRAAFFAAAMFAVLGPTLKLGAFATYDAMSLCLIALAAWCVTRAGSQRDAIGWLAAAAGALALSNATAYSSAILDPAIVALALFAWWRQPTTKIAVMRASALAAFTTATLIMLVTIGGSLYAVGISQTILSRASGAEPPSLIIGKAWVWTALVVAEAVAGLLICAATEHDHGKYFLLAALLGAALVVPIEQARIHTTTSLDKHVDFGVWLAAIAAGYAVSRFCESPPVAAMRIAAYGACALALAIPANIGLAQGREIFAWPNSARFVAAFRDVTAHDSGRILIDDTAVPKYYLRIPWQRWSTTSSITLPSGHAVSVPVGKSGNPATYERLISRHYFSVVALHFASKGSLNEKLISQLAQMPAYRLVRIVPYGRMHYGIWKYERTAGAR